MPSTPTIASLLTSRLPHLASQVRGSKPLAFADMWLFSIGTNSWRLITPSPAFDAPLPLRSPAERSHLSLVSLTDSTLLLYGGARCVPGCKCYGDTWVFETRTNAWTQINATDAPIHRYRQNLVVHAREGAVYLYGGESYQPYMYHNAVNRLLLPAPYADQMIASSGGGKGKGGGGGGRRGGNRRAQLAELSGGRATAEEEEPSMLASSAIFSSASSAASDAVAALGGSSGGPNLMLYLPAGGLLIGLAAWGMRSRRQRDR